MTMSTSRGARGARRKRRSARAASTSTRAGRDDPGALDRVFAALADATRRAILARLTQEPATITDLAAPFDMSFPAVSKHVRVLEDAGLVRRTIEGRAHRCSLDTAGLARADRWLAHYRAFWSGNLDALARFVERSKR